jgi:hypothetical protein
MTTNLTYLTNPTLAHPRTLRATRPRQILIGKFDSRQPEFVNTSNHALKLRQLQRLGQVAICLKLVGFLNIRFRVGNSQHDNRNTLQRFVAFDVRQYLVAAILGRLRSSRIIPGRGAYAWVPSRLRKAKASIPSETTSNWMELLRVEMLPGSDGRPQDCLRPKELVSWFSLITP